MRLGLCAPLGCTTDDVVLGLGETLRRLLGPMPPNDPVLLALLRQTDCGDTRGYPWTAGTWGVLGVCFALAALVAAATAVDMLQAWRRQGGVGKAEEAAEEGGQHQAPRPWGGVEAALLCFSLPRNWARLTAPGRSATPAPTEKEKEGARTAALDGVRALSMAWVVLGHTFIFAATIVGFANMTPDVAGALRPLTAAGQATALPPNAPPPGVMVSVGGQAMTNAYLAVETFLFLSGFLAVRGLLLRCCAAGKTTGLLKQAPTLYLLRFLRLTPAYALVLFLYWQVLGAAGGRGPVWRAAFKAEYGAWMVCFE
jgi:peptidoglycan/LPS O-acetylase OafA/YrhL